MKEIFLTICGLFLVSFSTVFAQVPQHDPIVIVPGIGGSWHWATMLNIPGPVFADGWKFTSTVKQYDRLIESFEDSGLIEGEDFFVAFYDWRQNNSDSAVNYLIPVIDEAIAYSSSGKVDIVAHSMGGLVTRSYIQSSAYRGDVDQFIMLGTPNHGSSDVYTLWEGANIPANWGRSLQVALGTFLWISKTSVTATFDDYDTIQNYIPSIQELLPTYDYLTDKDSGAVISEGSMQERNLFLSVLNLEGNKANLAFGVPGGISIIAGEGESTVGTIPVGPADPSDDPKLWVDGKPDPENPLRNDTGGDNRVLLSSAQLEIAGAPPGRESYRTNEKESLLVRLLQPFLSVVHAQIGLPPGGPPGASVVDVEVIPAKHGDLPTLAIPQIFETLGMSPPAVAYDPIPEPDSAAAFWFASPIEVQVTDPSGDTITKDTNSIPGAQYDGEDDPLGFKMVFIEDPEFGEYIVELLGLAEGGYHMGVGSFTGNGDFDATVEGNVTPGQRIGYAVSLSEGGTIEISDPYAIGEEMNPFDKFREAVQELHTFPHIEQSMLRQADVAEKAYEAGRTWQVEIILRRLELTIRIFRGWVIPNEKAQELFDILEEIKDFVSEH